MNLADFSGVLGAIGGLFDSRFVCQNLIKPQSSADTANAKIPHHR